MPDLLNLFALSLLLNALLLSAWRMERKRNHQLRHQVDIMRQQYLAFNQSNPSPGSWLLVLMLLGFLLWVLS